MPILEKAHNLVINGGTFVENTTNSSTSGASISSRVQIRDPLIQMLYNASVHGAPFDSQERFPPPMCHANTRTSILSDLSDWAKGSRKLRSLPIYWLYGPAGSGKSAIAQTFSERLREDNLLAASFFFSRQAPERNNNSRFIPTLAYQISIAVPSTGKHILKTIKMDAAILSKAPVTQAKELLVAPVVKALTSIWSVLQTKKWPHVIIIDGLDECLNLSEQRDILNIIKEALDKKFPCIFFIASRPEPNIHQFFRSPFILRRSRQVALDDESWKSQSDIRSYLHAMFAQLREEQPSLYLQKKSEEDDEAEEWPSNSVVELLVQKSSGNFIYASTVIKFITDGHSNPSQQLDIILGIIDRAADSESPYAALDILYSHILSLPKKPQQTLRVLAALIAIKSVATVELLEELCDVKHGDVRALFYSLYSILRIPEKRTDPIIIYHASFADFLLDQSRSQKYFVDIASTHTEIFQHFTYIWENWNLVGEYTAKYLCDNWSHHLEQCKPELQSPLRDAFHVKILPDIGNVMGAVLTAASPPSVELIAGLSELSPERIEGVIGHLVGHLLKIPSDVSKPIEFLGESVRTWLLDPSLSGALFVDLPKANRRIFHVCMQNIVTSSFIIQSLLFDYARKYWHVHLKLSGPLEDASVQDVLDRFYTRVLRSEKNAFNKRILNSLLVTRSSLISVVGALSAANDDDIYNSISHSFLVNRKPEDGLSMTFNHDTLREFLLDSSRSGDLSSDITEANTYIFCKCMQLHFNETKGVSIAPEVRNYISDNWHHHYDLSYPSVREPLVDGFYFRIISSLANSEPDALQALGMLLAVKLPLSEATLQFLFDDGLYFSRILSKLSLILNPPISSGEPISSIHPSFRDFILDKSRSKEYFINISLAHRLLYLRCVYILGHQAQSPPAAAIKYAEDNWTYHARTLDEFEFDTTFRRLRQSLTSSSS